MTLGKILGVISGIIGSLILGWAASKFTDAYFNPRSWLVIVGTGALIGLIAKGRGLGAFLGVVVSLILAKVGTAPTDTHFTPLGWLLVMETGALIGLWLSPKILSLRGRR